MSTKRSRRRRNYIDVEDHINIKEKCDKEDVEELRAALMKNEKKSCSKKKKNNAFLLLNLAGIIRRK